MFTKLWRVVVSVFILTSCAQDSGVKTTPLSISIDSSTTTQIALSRKFICIISEPEVPIDWSLAETLATWNLNKKNLFVQDLDSCDGQVEFWFTDSDEFWGETRFSYKDFAMIYLNVRTPKELKKHVMCHELGHVLGLPHTDTVSCMNIYLNTGEPSQEDLRAAGKDLWDWEYVSRHATGH